MVWANDRGEQPPRHAVPGKPQVRLRRSAPLRGYAADRDCATAV